MDRVAIVGIGQTRIEAAKERQNYSEMVYEAVKLALEDAGVGMDEVDNVVTTSNDFWDGRTISCMPVGGVSGGYDKNKSGVEGDGAFGAFYAACRTLSGAYGTTLVTAHSKGSESRDIAPMITNAAFDPVHARCLGLDMVTACALQARKYMQRYGITEEECARVSVKNHGNATENPNAQRALKITVDDVMQSERVSDPLKELDISPISDGACCLILANEDRARRFRPRPVWLKGVSFCADAFQLGDRDLSECKALEKAAARAYRMAGIQDPQKEIDVAEICDAFTYQELMWTEGLGFCGKGEGGKLVSRGATARDGDIPVNPSGGLLSGHPVIAAGMVRMIEAVRQIRGEAGGMQVRGEVKTALAHGVNGLCGQSHCVWVLGSE
jgi:acetyl-CoA C-acetyltransferase